MLIRSAEIGHHTITTEPIDPNCPNPVKPFKPGIPGVPASFIPENKLAEELVNKRIAWDENRQSAPDWQEIVWQTKLDSLKHLEDYRSRRSL